MGECFFFFCLFLFIYLFILFYFFGPSADLDGVVAAHYASLQ